MELHNFLSEYKDYRVNIITTEPLVEEDFTILGAWDSDPAKNIISYKTAMAQALLGKKVGDVVEIESGNTTETWKVESIRAYDS